MAVVMAQQARISHGVGTGWDALYVRVIGPLCGRTSASAEVVGVEPWVLRAEVSR